MMPKGEIKARDLVLLCQRKLAQNGWQEAQAEVYLILSHVCSLHRQYLILRPEQTVSQAEAETMNSILQRRLAGEPLAYILGCREFMGLLFQVNKHTLIPRADTEHLVEACLAYITENKLKSPRILEIGSGTGCISISLKKYAKNAILESWDISKEALEVARQNAEDLLGLEHGINFVHTDARDLANWTARAAGNFDLLVANPPYIGEQEIGEIAPDVWAYEPRSAYMAEEEGYFFYRLIAEQAKSILVANARIFLEMGKGQQEKISQIFAKNNWDSRSLFVLKDYNQIDRVFSITP